MRLTIKLILIIGALVTLTMSIIFTTTAIRISRQNREAILSSARSIYQNLLITREWVAEHDGVLVPKKPGMKPNPFLAHPQLITAEGDTLLLKNPALVTRELSELSDNMGINFSYHMASLDYINPVNRPDEFEKAALEFFDNTKTSSKEFFRFEEVNKRRYFRFFAPLYVKQSCLTCHSTQGYITGDLRGGISVLLDAEPFIQTEKSNVYFTIVLAILSVLLLSVIIFVALRKSVITPLRQIEDATLEIQEGNYGFSLNIPTKDEIGSLAVAMQKMGDRIKESTTYLKTSEAKYRSLVENSLEAVAIVNPEGKLIDFNNKLVRITGFKEEELKERDLFQMMNPENNRTIRGSLAGEKEAGIQATHYESVLTRGDGSEVPVEIYCLTGFRLGENDDLSFVYVRDLSERKQIEKYTLQAEKIFALGHLSSGIAHEIRNPLFALNNNIEFLNKKFSSQSDFSSVYPELKNSINRIHKIITTILDFSRPHKTDFASTNIYRIINNSISLVRKQLEKDSIRIEKIFDKEKIFIEADSHQIEQVFVNLFLNSYEAMGDSGTLKITAGMINGMARVSVEDNGRGISKDNIDYIFDPFYSTSPEGTGLGLAIVQRILDQHLASYNVESDEISGTCFTITFPLKHSQ